MHLEHRAATATLPSPLSVPTSDSFDGDDGKWSSFNINVGNDGSGNGQNFRVLISTSSAVTVVPQQAAWCDEECAKDRGVEIFQGSQSRGLETTTSKTWVQTGLYNIDLPKWFSQNLTLDPSGDPPGGVFGQDYVAYGQSMAGSRIASKQFVVAYSDKDFYNGWLGLAAGSTGVTNGSVPNFLDNLVGPDNPVIPSRSFGYSAGAHYKNNGRGVPGSLVLGGFDSSRTDGDEASIDMPSASDNTLTVGVQSVQYTTDPGVATNSQSFTFNDQRKEGGFYADIDSTVPYLILPDDICGFFADKFQLTYDEDLRYYLVNDSAHAWNQQQNPTVTFKIGVGTQDSLTNFANIVLPYVAFDWQLSPPKVNQTTQYFPIRRSGDGRPMLGRTFLQEAYLIVDYESMNFKVAPAVLEKIPKQTLVPIFPKDYVPPAENSGGGGAGGGGGLATGAIAGIVVSIVLAFAAAGVAAFLFLRRRRKANNKGADPGEASEIDTTYAGNEVKYRRVSELTGSELQSPKDSAAGYYSADKSVPPISEMSPESTPAELYSPPPDGREALDYFAVGRVRRRGATRDSSGHNSPRTPIAELSGEDAVHPTFNEEDRGPSDMSLKTKIDEVLANKRSSDAKTSTEVTKPSVQSGEPATADEIAQAEAEASVGVETTGDEQEQHASTERRPSHTRGLSDVTIQSDSTTVSQPTPEERERWARTDDEGPRRPMSP